MEDELQWKATFGGIRPSVEDDFWWKTILACCLGRFAAFFFVGLDGVVLVDVGGVGFSVGGVGGVVGVGVVSG